MPARLAGITIKEIRLVAKKLNNSYPAFGMRDKLGYMFGDFGNDFTFILSSSFMLSH